VASLVAVSLLSGIGAWQWWGSSSGHYSNMQFLHHEVALIDQRAMHGEPLHAAERHYITHGLGLLIGQMGLGYQVYELATTMAIDDIRTALMVRARRRSTKTMLREDRDIGSIVVESYGNPLSKVQSSSSSVSSLQTFYT